MPGILHCQEHVDDGLDPPWELGIRKGNDVNHVLKGLFRCPAILADPLLRNQIINTVPRRVNAKSFARFRALPEVISG